MKSSKTLQLLDMASQLVTTSAMTGNDIPIPELAMVEGNIEDHLLALFHVERRITAEKKLIQQRLDHHAHQRHRVRQAAIKLVLAHAEMTGTDDGVRSNALRATVKLDREGNYRITWREE